MDMETRNRTLYREILAPTFPPEELVAEEDFLSAMADGSLLAHLETDADGRVVALAIAERFPGEVLLLSWLAVHPQARAGGLGSRVLARALEGWQADVAPRMMLGEVEHPLSTPAHPDHGDPASRLRFYQRFGVRALPVAHVQPALRPGCAPVDKLMLCVFRDAGLPPADEVETAPVRDFLTAYLDGLPARRDQALACLDGDRLPTITLDAPVGQLPNSPVAPVGAVAD